MIALESLFIYDKNEPIRSSVSKRVAFLLSKDIKIRIKVEKDIKKLYDLRSEIVHGGLRQVTKKQLKITFDYIQNIILSLIIRKNRLKIKTLEDIKYWFKIQELK